ncbi:hypothetical protein [Alteromonas macleodii]|jgi:hypothetical protein|uniref:hypothetical protein n=1 Tax=Alteromonas macleodii TaxID=28108 RepID=UPI0019308D6C|nr:hypothetical protein [Alteromonas macleodii]|tara:strand:- start:1079 stop:1462 length:384 start_codon:yes stop_codon:yes gene_type:complete
MRLIFLLLLLVNFGCLASSCIVTDEMRAQFNSKHVEDVAIETALRDSKFSVTIKLPESIEGQSSYSVRLVSDSLEEPTFTFPLDLYEEDNKTKAWYEIDAGLVRKHFVVVSLNDYCAPSIFKEVFYQ